jgi:hypothetical protein
MTSMKFDISFFGIQYYGTTYIFPEKKSPAKRRTFPRDKMSVKFWSVKFFTMAEYSDVLPQNIKKYCIIQITDTVLYHAIKSLIKLFTYYRARM